jgi:sterol desaturase/sphingolipid hydroxylase (fatty acid hydroxylase superfamily)
LHQLHHDPRLMAHYNFNITYPIGDLLFGTLWRGRGRSRSGTGPGSVDVQTRSNS